MIYVVFWCILTLKCAQSLYPSSHAVVFPTLCSQHFATAWALSHIIFNESLISCSKAHVFIDFWTSAHLLSLWQRMHPCRHHHNGDVSLDGAVPPSMRNLDMAFRDALFDRESCSTGKWHDVEGRPTGFHRSTDGVDAEADSSGHVLSGRCERK